MFIPEFVMGVIVGVVGLFAVLILAKEGRVVLDGKTLKKSVDKAGRQAGAAIMVGGVMA